MYLRMREGLDEGAAVGPVGSLPAQVSMREGPMVATKETTVVVLLDDDSEFQAYRKIEQAARMWQQRDDLSLLADAVLTAITPFASGVADRAVSDA